MEFDTRILWICIFLWMASNIFLYAQLQNARKQWVFFSKEADYWFTQYFEQDCIPLAEQKEVLENTPYMIRKKENAE